MLNCHKFYSFHNLHDKHSGLLTGGGVAWNRRTPTFTLWSPECEHPASQPPTLTLYTNNTPESSPQLHPNNTPRPKGLLQHSKPTARFHLLTPPAECPSCGGSPRPDTPKSAKSGLMRGAELYKFLGGSTRSLASLSSCSTTRGGSVSSGEDSWTVEELHSALTAAFYAYTDASNLHVPARASSPSTDSVKNARLAVLFARFGIVIYMCILLLFSIIPIILLSFKCLVLIYFIFLNFLFHLFIFVLNAFQNSEGLVLILLFL